jgi:manganese transport protein
MAENKNRKPFLLRFSFKNHRPLYGALDVLKYIGPGLLVTVGFIDPGNWASNLAAGSGFGYKLLWILTLSTTILIILQHNVAHLGIATGLCLSEATNKYIHKRYSKIILSTGMMASVSTSLAEILGGAIGLNMLFRVPLRAGAVLVVLFVLIMLFTNTYRAIEKWIIAFVSIIGLSFIYELSLVHIDWGEAVISWIVPSIPAGSMIIIMSVLGAVVMPHNLFLHSEIIQSRQWNLEDKKFIRRQLDFEFLDTFTSMIVGFAINSSIILLAVATFYRTNTRVDELQQARHLLEPLLGSNAAVVFAVALLFSGIASSITSGMAAGSIFAGFFGEPLDIKDNHSRLGVLISLVVALIFVFLISNPFKGLILSQMILSMQLPVTIYTQIYLTSSGKVMGEYRNTLFMKILLHLIGSIITILNIMLLVSFFK